MSMTVLLCLDCTELKNEKFDPMLTDNYDPDGEMGNGFHEFSKTPCYVCGDTLHGYRYEFTAWSDELGQCDTCSREYELASRDGRCGDCGNCADHCDHDTLPCQTCGVAVPADIHAEELGFCIPCQHAYFDHEGEN